MSVLLGEGGAKLPAAGVEPLLLQDLGQAGVSLELAQAPAAYRGNLRITCSLIDWWVSGRAGFLRRKDD
jgi:hypothetical protein